MHWMNDPEDLDVFEGRQAQITAKADQTGKQGLDNFLGNLLMRCNLTLPELINEMPIEMWQRAAYEAHSLAQREPTEFNKGKADVLWLHVRFIQDSLRLGKSLLENKALRKEALDRGYEMPVIPEE